MRVVADQLTQQLQRQAPQVLLLNGNETLLVEEALDTIRCHYRELGVVERLSYVVDSQFGWDSLSQSGGNLSLFSESRLIELRLPTAKPGTKGSQFFADFIQQTLNQETRDVLLVVTDYLNKQQRKAKWLQQFEQHGLLIDCYEIKTEQLPQWIKQRLQSKALRVEPGVVDMIAKATEGNLLATAQIIDQLSILSADGGVTLDLLYQTIEDQSRFSVYHLVDSCLLGLAEQCIHRLSRIRAEADNAVLVVWSLVRETRELLEMSNQLTKGDSINQVMQQYRVWSSRQRFVSSALHRLSYQKLLSILSALMTIDAIVKGQQHGNVWHELEKLCLVYCGLETFSELIDN